MNALVKECFNYFKDCGFTYAICGGYAIELFLNKSIRNTHSDIDISIFDEDRKAVVDFMLKQGWGIFQNIKINPDFKGGSASQIKSSDDERVLNVHCAWAIRPNSTTFKVTPSVENNIFNYKIINKNQTDFDYIEILFNSKYNDDFICDKNKGVARAMNKAILYVDKIPYLSPELILFFKSPPAYLESGYHKEKCQADFDEAIPFLSIESKQWLIAALEKTYPDGHKWLERLK